MRTATHCKKGSHGLVQHRLTGVVDKSGTSEGSALVDNLMKAGLENVYSQRFKTHLKGSQMITTLYIRVAQYEDQLIIKASPHVNHEALTKREGRQTYVCPTVNFAIEVDIPQEMFEQAEQVILYLFFHIHRSWLCTKELYALPHQVLQEYLH